MASILLVDDDEGFVQATRTLLEMLGHDARSAASVAEANAILQANQFDIVLLDLMLPDGSGLHVLDALNGSRKQPGHIAIVTGHPTVKSLVKTVCGPNISYLIKPIDIEQIKALIEKTSPELSEVDAPRHFNSLIGESPAMRELYQMIERVAQTRANVLLQGESGVGKELVARAIHAAGGSQGPFVAANCGALSRELIGSELFGHEKGSFTGAVSRKIGLFEQAKGGVLFLDEVTEMPIDMQPTLLRVLETNKVIRVGGAEEIPVDCRVVSATNRTQQQLAEDECLREDIYFRLAVFPIQIPPLRQRREDIPLLARRFLQELNEENGSAFGLGENNLKRLQDYDWPGNVRELRHAIHRAFIMTDPAQSELSLPDNLASPFARERQGSPGLQVGKTIEEMERELITLTLAQLDGDKRRAADMLGISLKTLYNRLNSYGENENTETPV
ncbi:sigma 54-dependent transcriptional activator containing CheY-like receiver domain [Hahella chejuensis KCTC 2396]|uniref:Sigma 54-dependent transcriptional activator containing CheY-like receiver domain n=1 Tax=Hahella chejuensis (strain KCTC 2396) TaxID=349521 RepID=Q2SCK6_HAHCH|nr:sigma-54 dependent transcriptional regulator [Hahella chejuensis]ABC31618.1 sigma 54-dependent transcriptional activator containing CheY-like receiver domain [Hahella chejuensis KCTC 2396]